MLIRVELVLIEEAEVDLQNLEAVVVVSLLELGEVVIQKKFQVVVAEVSLYLGLVEVVVIYFLLVQRKIPMEEDQVIPYQMTRYLHQQMVVEVIHHLIVEGVVIQLT